MRDKDPKPDGPRRRRARHLLPGLFAAALVASTAAHSAALAPVEVARIDALPLLFEPSAPAVPTGTYLGRGLDHDALLDPGGLRLRDRRGGGGAIIDIRLQGASPEGRLAARDPVAGTSHYLRGKDRAGWRTDVPRFARVTAEAAYPGIDVVYYGNQHRLEYDFIVAPGADPALIRLAVTGAAVDIDGEGDLHLTRHGAAAGTGGWIQKAPTIYQRIAGRKVAVPGGYRQISADVIGFEIGPYDRDHPLVIDPILVYASHIGGTGNDRGLAIAVDGSGNIFLAGSTDAADFPASAGAYDGTCGSTGTCDATVVSPSFTYVKPDAFVSKLDSNGNILFTTFLGGSEFDQAVALAVDATGNIVVLGETRSIDFPATGGSYDPACTDTTPADNLCDEGLEVFVAQLDSTGAALNFATYLGGTADDEAHALAVDATGIYVGGATLSRDFPTTGGAYDTTYNGKKDGFLAKLDPTGATLSYATFLGGGSADAIQALATDATGNAYVTGFTGSADFPTTAGVVDTLCGDTGTCDDGTSGVIAYDAFVSKLDAAAATLVYSTYLGGQSYDYGNAIRVDSGGNATIAGETRSANFPATAGAYQTALAGSYDGYVASLNVGATALNFATFFGGGSGDSIEDLAVDGGGNLYLTGSTYSTDLPVASPAFTTPVQRTDNAVLVRQSDAFVTKLAAGGATLTYSTYFGGASSDYARAIAVDGSNNAYITGYTISPDLPVSATAAQRAHADLDGNNAVDSNDAFVAKINDGGGDLSVVISDGQDPVEAGQPLTYTAVITNNGAGTAEGVRLDYTLPYAVAFVSANSAAGTCTAVTGAVSCTLGSLAASASANVTIAVTPRNQGTITSTMSVSGHLSDGNTGNNADSETTTVDIPTPTSTVTGTGALGWWTLALALLAVGTRRARARASCN